MRDFLEKILNWLKPDNWDDETEQEVKLGKVNGDWKEQQVKDIADEPKFKILKKGRRHDIWKHFGWLAAAIAVQMFLLFFVSILAGKFLFNLFLSAIVSWQVFSSKKEGRGWKTKISLSILSFILTLFISYLFLDNVIANFQLAVYCIIGTAIFVWLLEEKTGKDLYPNSVGLLSLIFFLVLSLVTIDRMFESGQYWAERYSIPLEAKFREIGLSAQLARTKDGIFSVKFWEFHFLRLKNNLPTEFGRWSYLFDMISFLLSYLLAFFAFFLIASWKKVSVWIKGGSMGDAFLAALSIDGLTKLVKTLFQKIKKRQN